ncbi:hypothetical protein GCM10009539_25760 [Cryptosporangium japonicum]|uniref:Uncharacterized protein n=1 Tax=Cryptosporangium japonicum TaxID=80872 RepID=A0ABN0U5C0_9ACTN
MGRCGRGSPGVEFCGVEFCGVEFCGVKSRGVEWSSAARSGALSLAGRHTRVHNDARLR